MEKSLLEFLNNYNKDIYPFHMPGHKRNMEFFKDIDFLNLDITEIEGADNLKKPEGIIRQAEEKIAKAYGAKKSYMLVNGSSIGILAAIMYCVRDGDEILIGRNSHQSVYNGLILSGASPCYVYPEITNYGMSGGISSDSVKSILEKQPKIKAIFITSPTFEGFCSDIESISEITKSLGKFLIVDEAHGAHFGFHEGFPKSAISLGADIVIQSFHKTLPAINQSAVMHVSGNKVNTELMKNFIDNLQTSSPSYILLAIMEKCIDLFNCNSDIFRNYYQLLCNFRKSMDKYGLVKLIDEKIEGKYAIHKIDKGKLVFITNPRGLGAEQIYYKMLSDYKIQLEMHSLNHFIAMTSVCDTELGFSRLGKTIEELDLLYYKEDMNGDRFDEFEKFDFKNVLVEILPRQAIYMPSKSIPLEQSENKISAVFIIPYPPGIPLVAPGEVITKDILELINIYRKNGINMLGLERDGGYCKVISN